MGSGGGLAVGCRPADAGQSPGGQNANADHPNPGLLCVFEQAAVILRRIVWRQRGGSRRIQHVVADLGAVDQLGVNDLMQRRRLANRGNPQEPGLARLAQRLEGRNDFVAKPAPR